MSLKKFCWGIAFVAGLLLPTIGEANAAELKIHVTNLQSGDGAVYFAVYDKPETFPKRTGELVGTKLPAKSNGVVAVFADLKPGTYAVAIYHDENSNGKFDQGFLGIPLEGYAFSNNAPVFLGPPEFEDAAVTINGKGTEITIKMDY
jgi:uncharacterized protein (DUF2141 family)